MTRRRPIAPLALATGAVGVAVILASGNRDPHTLRAAFESAVQVVPGQPVRVGGRKVGGVRAVGLADGRAVVTMAIDRSAWPLRRGTVARLRYDSSASYALRSVELDPGPPSAPALPDGGILATADTITPVEFDQVYRIFGPHTRRNLQGLLDNAQETLHGRARDLAQTVSQGAGGLQGLADVMADLGHDPHALDTLVRAGDRTVAALHGRDGELQALVANAAATFDELARHARAQQATLERLPGALDEGRMTLARVDRSIGGWQGLVDDIAPGARGLRALAPALTRALTTLRAVAPQATALLTTGERAAPAIGGFLGRATTFLPPLSDALRGLAPMVACIRPYGPEIAGFWGTWVGFQGNSDALGPYARAAEQKSLIPVGTSQNAAQLTDTLRNRLFYAFPRPPGLNAGHPWFQPQCGGGPGALDPRKDPEGHQ